MLHVLFIKIAETIPKPWKILFQNFAERLRVGLTDNTLKCIAIDKCLLYGGVRVKVKVELYLLFGSQCLHKLKNIKDRWTL